MSMQSTKRRSIIKKDLFWSSAHTSAICPDEENFLTIRRSLESRGDPFMMKRDIPTSFLLLFLKSTMELGWLIPDLAHLVYETRSHYRILPFNIARMDQ